MGSGGFPGMGWNGSPNFGAMNPYIANGMFNFPNAMGTFSLDIPVRRKSTDSLLLQEC
jgi:hypothetical protein